MTEDERLLKNLRRGDASAIEEIIDIYSPYVVKVIMNQLGSSASMEDAEELASNVFYSLWQNRAKLRTDNLRGWLAACARNAAVSHVRKNRAEMVDIEDYIAVSGENVEKLCEQQERSRYLTSTLDKLDRVTRQVFVRHFYYGETLSDISQALSLNNSTVKSRLRRGKEKLKEELIKGGYSCED